MPELPEVESVRRSLRGMIGRHVIAVDIRRYQVITGPHTPADLLVGARIRGLERQGKELLILSDGRALAVHLGMTGSMRHVATWGPQQDRIPPAKHVHVRWYLEGAGFVEFHDPRRFGGIWTFPDSASARTARWGRLGPDAERITAPELFRRLQRTRRAIKAALLDQHQIAGLGNIYVDELLFACRIRPTVVAQRLTLAQVRGLVGVMRRLLHRAIHARGSSIRSYVDAAGRPGSYQLQHQVYGHGGQPCPRCRTTLRSIRVGGRTSVFCPRCQPVRPVGSLL
jgi:formamidopyrimidine-DNA glycosylase